MAKFKVTIRPLYRPTYLVYGSLHTGSGHGASRVPVLLSRLQGLIGSLAEEWLSDKLEETFAPHNCATMLHKLHLVISGLAQGASTFYYFNIFFSLFNLAFHTLGIHFNLSSITFYIYNALVCNNF